MGALAPDPANPTTHDDSNVAAIAASLREFGQVKNVVGNRRTGLLIAGHGTLEAARRLGWTHLACAWIDCDERTAHRLMLADNRTAELAGYDQDLLDELLTATVQPDDELFDRLAVNEISDALVDEVLGGDEPPEPQLDRAEELQEQWQTAPGQLWEIEGKGGMHRVCCGDTREMLPTLLDASIDMVFTDPPYGHNNNDGDLIHRWPVPSRMTAPKPTTWCNSSSGSLLGY